MNLILFSKNLILPCSLPYSLPFSGLAPAKTYNFLLLLQLPEHCLIWNSSARPHSKAVVNLFRFFWRNSSFFPKISVPGNNSSNYTNSFFPMQKNIPHARNHQIHPGVILFLDRINMVVILLWTFALFIIDYAAGAKASIRNSVIRAGTVWLPNIVIIRTVYMHTVILMSKHHSNINLIFIDM